MIATLVMLAALNANPSFITDGEVLPGWRLIGAARSIRDTQGTPCVLTEEGAAQSDLFPVTDATQIEVTLTACGPKYLRKRTKVWAAVSFFATPEEAKAPGAQWRLARPKLEIATTGISERREIYPVPPNAKWCRLTVRGGTAYVCEAKVK